MKYGSRRPCAARSCDQYARGCAGDMGDYWTQGVTQSEERRCPARHGKLAIAGPGARIARDAMQAQGRWRLPCETGAGEGALPIPRWLSTGPRTEEGRAPIAEAQRRRWRAYQATQSTQSVRHCLHGRTASS